MSTTDTKNNLLAGTGIRPSARGTDYLESWREVIDILAEKSLREIVLKWASDSQSSTDKATSEKSAKVCED